MPPEPIRYSAASIDLSPRFQDTSVIAASPADATETLIATLALAGFGDLALATGVRLQGWAAFTVGTNGDGANLRIRQTNASGTVVAASGLVTEVAADLDEIGVLGLDAGAGAKVYVLTLEVDSASAPSTVSALHLSATII